MDLKAEAGKWADRINGVTGWKGPRKHRSDTVGLWFLRGKLTTADSCTASFSTLMRDAAPSLVGVYRPGVTPAQIEEDLAEVVG